MGTDNPKPRTQLGEYLGLLSQRDSAGCPFIIVGGQAANFWAALYLPREPRLHQHLPLTSKDLDLIGTKEDATRVAQTIKWHLSPPPVGGGPVAAVLSSEAEGKGLTAEFLSEIKGVSHDTIAQYARDNLLRAPEGGAPVPVRVLDPVMLLAGKIRNAVDIEQDRPDRPRQDLKHVAMLGLCVPHFLEELRARAIDEPARLEVCRKYLAMLASLKNTYSGRRFEAEHPGTLHWAELIPESIRQMPLDDDTRRSLGQLAAVRRSRGMRI
jgi:hypothetical protein